MMIRLVFSILLGATLLHLPIHAQMVFSAPAQFGNRTGTGLFIEQNGQVAQLPTGFPEHNFPALSRDNRFVVFQDGASEVFD